MILLIIGTLVVVSITYLVFSTRKPANFPPGPFWYPIFGSTFELRKYAKALGGLHLAVCRISEIYKSNVISLKLGKEKVIVVSTYPTVKAVFVGEEYEGRPNNFFINLRCMGTRRGITTTDGELWKIQRTYISAHFRNLGYGKIRMQKMIKDEVNNLHTILEETGDNEVIIAPILSVSVLNVLWTLVSGSRLNRTDSRLTRLLNLLSQRNRAFDLSGGLLNHLPWIRFFAPEKTGYNLIRKINFELKELLLETIYEHYSTWKPGRDDDLIYSFISEMKRANGTQTTFTEDQLVMVCLDIFIAGSQTTSATIDFCILVMILYPDIQEKVRKCLEQAFSKSEEITYSERHRVPYVVAVICEIQRYYTIAPVAGPRRVLRDVILENYLIPTNTTVLINIYSVHYDKDYWQDPQVFRPERFLDIQGNLVHHDRFIPFGLGRRRCFGDLLSRNCIFMFFVEIIRNYKITEYPGSEKPTGRYISGMTLSPEKYKAQFTKC